MKILFAADGSKFTRRALAFLVAHPELTGEKAKVVVVNVQSPIPGRIGKLLDHGEVASFHREEAEKVFKPIERALGTLGVAFRCDSVVGSPVAEIIKAAAKAKADFILMGTHGHGIMGRALMGSVAQRVVADGDIPVLLVK